MKAQLPELTDGATVRLPVESNSIQTAEGLEEVLGAEIQIAAQ